MSYLKIPQAFIPGISLTQRKMKRLQQENDDLRWAFFVCMIVLPRLERLFAMVPPQMELDKMLAVKDKSQACGEFVDWLHDEKGVVFAERYPTPESGLVPKNLNLGKLLAEFFEIDLDRVEREKRDILKQLRKEGG